MAKLKEADHIIQSEKRYEQLRFEKMKDAWTDACMQPSTDINVEAIERSHSSLAWRPWHEEDREEDMDEDEQHSNDKNK